MINTLLCIIIIKENGMNKITYLSIYLGKLNKRNRYNILLIHLINQLVFLANPFSKQIKLFLFCNYIYPNKTCLNLLNYFLINLLT